MSTLPAFLVIVFWVLCLFLVLHTIQLSAVPPFDRAYFGTNSRELLLRQVRGDEDIPSPEAVSVQLVLHFEGSQTFESYVHSRECHLPFMRCPKRTRYVDGRLEVSVEVV